MLKRAAEVSDRPGAAAAVRLTLAYSPWSLVPRPWLSLPRLPPVVFLLGRFHSPCLSRQLITSTSWKSSGLLVVAPSNS